jgi:PAS domain S-box-containing protein
VFDFLGYQPEEIVGRIPFDLMAPDEAKRIEALFATIFASQSPFSNLENRNLHKDGQIVVLETSGLPIVDNEDVFRGYRGIDRDITERKRADAAQQEVLTKLQTLLENVEQGILYEDETRHVQFSNNTFCELFGIPSPQIILGAACDALALQAQGSFADPEEFINGVQNRLDQQVVVLSEELNLADGRIFERDYIPVIISGRQSGNYWIYRDITGRKQADGALSESEARFRSLIEQSTDGVVLIDAQGIVIEWNTAESLITGIPLSRALGASFSEIQYQILIPEHREKLNPEYLRKVFFELFQSGNAGRLGIPQDIEIISLSGERKFVQQTSFLVRSDKGNRIGAIVRDVTKQKKMEDALRRSEEKYRSLAENIESGVATVDAQGVLHYINSVAAAALGGNPEDLTGKRLHQLFPLEVADHQLKSIRHVIASGQGTVRETQNIIAAGMRWYRASIQPIRSAGGAGLALIHVIDITARKESEEKIRSTLEEKESLLREVHHRVKNNLQAMIALMDMQSRLIAEEDSRGFLKELKGQARTMALVYEQLYQSDNLARVEMAPYIGQLTANILEVFGRNRHIELNLNITSLLDVGDATPCGLIINELFTNILKYAFPSGFVGRPTVTIDLHQEGRTCHLTVSDNGVGLPPDLDLRSSPTLGLRLVNLWVTHQLGGTLEVDGQSGTTFSIFFETQQ